MNEDLGNPSRTCLVRGGLWEEDILIAEMEELEKLDASEICPRRLNAKRSPDNPEKMENLYFLWQMVQQTYQEETTNSKNPL